MDETLWCIKDCISIQMTRNKMMTEEYQLYYEAQSGIRIARAQTTNQLYKTVEEGMQVLTTADQLGSIEVTKPNLHLNTQSRAQNGQQAIATIMALDQTSSNMLTANPRALAVCATPTFTTQRQLQPLAQSLNVTGNFAN
ncbi:unnamed protein product [Ceratitis capitata]|uniref:(Mediterranean fruit fly) hypothetical protein n=1 Tax=Ceratitis capitata TaxID=7213 RepID=A0A811V5W9_CERCA|nr:unnamed protein product [Ceratitis capitata]